MPLRSFRDPVTNVLICSGYVASNKPGDISQIEAEGFNLTPGLWKWDGADWIAFIPPPKPKEVKQALAAAKIQALPPGPFKDAFLALSDAIF